ncbi:hypothetical protein ACIGXM_12610 [Kitasatospora sp. NPDC052896]|uniref:hypothetical protein n=1 Tax=Kitasatospora sp. NPDC052896 TaxID=3364061 RepID=UPI0037C5650F
MSLEPETVSFAFLAEREAGEWRGTVLPPRPRPSFRALAGRLAIGLVLAAGLVTAVLLGTPALTTPPAHGPVVSAAH